jgi:hypothetical protein
VDSADEFEGRIAKDYQLVVDIEITKMAGIKRLLGSQLRTSGTATGRQAWGRPGLPAQPMEF